MPVRWARLAALAGSAAAHIGATGLGVLVLGVSADSVLVIDFREAITHERPEPPPERPAARPAEPIRTPRAPKSPSLASRRAPTSGGALSPPAMSPTMAVTPEPLAVPKESSAPEKSERPEPAPPADTAASTPVSTPAPGVEPAAAPSERAAPARGVEPAASGEPGPVAGAAAGAGRPRGAGPGRGETLARAIPDGDGVPAEYGPYLARFRGRVQEALVYPLTARRRGLTGTVEIEVLIDDTGAVTSTRLIASSSHAVLDDAALRAVRSVARLPLPDGLPRRPLRVRLPLGFVLE